MPAGSPPIRPLTVVYLALVASVFTYAAVLELAPIDTSQEALAPVVPLAFVALGVTSTALSFVVPLFLRRNAPGAGRLDAAAQARTAGVVLSWAMAESIGVFGLVLGLLNAPHAWPLVFFGWSLAVLAVHHPFGRRRSGDAGP